MREQWQPKLGSPGEQVNGLAELAQSLSIVLRTPLGSVPGRPRFGSELHELIDASLEVVRARAPRMVRDAAGENLPRMEIVETRALSTTGLAHFELEITWRVKGGTEVQTTGVPV
ncbi:MAG TPA: hypothetical protein VN764_12635 [Polyangiaceae bacterium]|nr:hypothetical protein [Polyangiaceae bacterium]